MFVGWGCSCRAPCCKLGAPQCSVLLSSHSFCTNWGGERRIWGVFLSLELGRTWMRAVGVLGVGERMRESVSPAGVVLPMQEPPPANPVAELTYIWGRGVARLQQQQMVP